MPADPITVTLIGRGRIGTEVAQGMRRLPGYRVEAVLGRDATALPRSQLTIDLAGPAALRAHGMAALSHGDLWSVGAAALIDDDLRSAMDARAREAGHVLRLFTGWISGPALCPPGEDARLFIRQSAPDLGDRPGVVFDGPLAEAAIRFPDHLNTATATAICGPGIGATRVTLTCSAPGTAHRIFARFVMPGQTIRTEVRFDRPGPHPVASAILAALARNHLPVTVAP
jgi:predicted dinucleotide-utilizing enzyme